MIDWARVNTLRDEIGEEDFIEVAAMFLEEADEIVASLMDAPAESELEGQFHALKGSALNLGLSDFAEICRAQEKFAATGVFDQIEIEGAVTCYKASKSEFTAKIGLESAA